MEKETNDKKWIVSKTDNIIIHKYYLNKECWKYNRIVRDDIYFAFFRTANQKTIAHAFLVFIVFILKWFLLLF